MRIELERKGRVLPDSPTTIEIAVSKQNAPENPAAMRVPGHNEARSESKSGGVVAGERLF